MDILINIILFIIGFVLKDVLKYIYNINKKIEQANEIIQREQKRMEFKNKYDFSDSIKSNSESEEL